MTIEGHTCETWEIKPSLDAIDHFQETELRQEKQNPKDVSNSSKCSLLFPCSSAGDMKATSFPSCWSKEPPWWAIFNSGLNLRGRMILDWRTSRTKNQN